MRIEQSYPSPVHGVSTLAPRSRPQGYATKQINFRSDPVNKLTRRPPSLWKAVIATVTDINKVQYHSYYRNGKEFSFIADTSTGVVYCAIDEVIVNVVTLGSYNGDNLGFYSVEDDTYVLNKDVVVEKLPDTDDLTIQRVSHINVTSALNYSETVKLNITFPNGTRDSVEYTVPALGDPVDYDAADAARATAEVAKQLAVRLNSIITTGTQNLQAHSLGSSVSVRVTGFTGWCQIEVESGQGDRTTVAINKIIETTAGLPLYAVVGTRITVRPDPTSEKGIYYLQAERIADDPTGEILEEVVWSEDRNPYQAHSFDTATLPHIIKYKKDTNNFVFGEVLFKSRQTGDDESAPFPEFLGETISTMGYFQKRLVAVSENSVYMTETDDLENWFRQSAVTLLVTDPIGVATSELGTDKILHLVPHNRDLLCITSNSQFKISGQTALTPETVSMPLTTKYECQVSVSPVAIGNSVYFPIDYGDSTGVQEYTGEQNTSQDFASPITNHIIGYLKGTAKLMAASPNLEMIAMTTTGSANNELYIYEQYTEAGGKRSQRSWSTWQFADNETIVDIKFRKNELILLVAKDKTLVVKAIPMYTRVTASPLDVYLDDMLILPTGDGITLTVPTGYLTDGCIAVRGDGTDNELWKVGFTRVGDTITLSENIGTGEVYMGRQFTSAYEPTRPFKYDEDGTTITTDKLRVSRWVLSLVDTHELSMTKQSQYGEDITVDFEARFVGDYRLGTIDAYTGDWKFSFAENAALATPLFFTDKYLGCTISDVSWEGQYFQSKQRM